MNAPQLEVVWDGRSGKNGHAPIPAASPRVTPTRFTNPGQSSEARARRTRNRLVKALGYEYETVRVIAARAQVSHVTAWARLPQLVKDGLAASRTVTGKGRAGVVTEYRRASANA